MLPYTKGYSFFLLVITYDLLPTSPEAHFSVYFFPRGEKKTDHIFLYFCYPGPTFLPKMRRNLIICLKSWFLADILLVFWGLWFWEPGRTFSTTVELKIWTLFFFHHKSREKTKKYLLPTSVHRRPSQLDVITSKKKTISLCLTIHTFHNLSAGCPS